MSVKERASELEGKIREYKLAYYQWEEQKVEDDLYDALVAELNFIYQRNPEYRPTDSVLSGVGAPPARFLDPIQHEPRWLPPTTIGTNQNMDFNTFMYYINQAMGEVGESKPALRAIPYIEGVDISVTYIDGKLKHILTRGDGTYGEDITCNLSHLKSIPDTLNLAKGKYSMRFKGSVVVRGRLAQTTLAQSTRSLEGHGQIEDKLDISRAIRCRDEARIRAYNITFYPNEVVYHLSVDDTDDSSHKGNMDFLRMCGFDTTYEGGTIDCDSNSVDKHFNKFYRNVVLREYNGTPPKILGVMYRPDFDFANPADGYFMEHSHLPPMHEQYDLNVQVRLFKDLPQITTIEGVIDTIDRHGAIHPTVILNPIKTDLSGLDSVSWAAKMPSHDHLYNTLGARVGDAVHVKRVLGNQLTITEVLKEHRDGTEETNPLDTIGVCPYCGSELEGLSPAKCTEWDSCTGVFEKILEYWGSSHVNNIHGLTHDVCEALVKTGLVTNLFSLYTFDVSKASDVLYEYGIDSVAISTLVANIAKSVGVSQLQTLAGLSIPGVGVDLASSILTRYRDINHFFKPGPWSCFDSSIPRFTLQAGLSISKIRRNQARIDDIMRLTTPAALNGIPKEVGLLPVVSVVNQQYNTSLLKGIRVRVDKELTTDTLLKDIKEYGGNVRKNGDTNLHLVHRSKVKNEDGFYWTFTESSTSGPVLVIGLDNWDDTKWTGKFSEIMSSETLVAGSF